ncbi:Ger(x)C family spore germination C-terminal domain-containing protein [Paenibacillus sp. NFR01]|uniref:Ger(x)C family spore germination C-terminal domain-containing protein n=1 Tax=Paenibacillus sp. NFR01 TaxID=1566279 RepID=UPI0008AAD51F|nr:Ger(x)C family spore germination C-terminal domain-containing protein [Paenibacillus sp. NFR01]SET07174.1 germination protein, Ger(x)C family [Paenibacillus sp. NFR01]
MKKVGTCLILLLVLTGCWDQMRLRDIHLVDIAGLDFDKKNGEFKLSFAVTQIKNAGQGGGEAVTETTELKASSLIEAIGQGEYKEQGPFLASNTRLFLMSEAFASNNPIKSLGYLLHAPYTSINAPVVVYEGSVSEFLHTEVSQDDFSKKVNRLIASLETNGIISNVSMMHFILSKEDELEDIALPVVRPSDSGLELGGALLFRHGMSTGIKLSNEEIRLVMLMLGRNIGMQKITGRLQEDKGSAPSAGGSKGDEFAFSVKKVKSKTAVIPKSGSLPTASIHVQLAVNVYQIDGEGHPFKKKYVQQVEKEFGQYLQSVAITAIEKLQKANCDLLDIGDRIRAFHPATWEALDWRTDYPHLPVDLKMNVEILNTEAE